MKLLSLFFLLYKLNKNYFRVQKFFIQFISSIFYGFFYLLEYIAIFFFEKKNMYMFIIYIYFVKKKTSKKKIIKKQEVNKYIKFFNKLYYRRRMY